MFSLIVEIDTWQVAGYGCPQLPDVRVRIAQTLASKARMPAKDDFERLMETMTRTLEAGPVWQHTARGVAITVRRFGHSAGTSRHRI